MGQSPQVAVFIDYDNIEMSVSDILGKGVDVDWSRVLQVATELGRVVLRRAYADWAEAADKQRELLSLGVELIHVNSKRGKNAADIRIVIDMLELLYSEQNEFTHVLLVSGDGDFTELAHRLRTKGIIVYGVGVSGTTAKYLINACDKFIFYDKLPGISKAKKTSNAPAQQRTNNPSAKNQPTQRAPQSENKVERYLNILQAHKVRMAPTQRRPLIIYKIYDIIRGNPGFSFNEMTKYAQDFFATAAPDIDPQYVLDTAHQLFQTFCFQFAKSKKRIMDQTLSLAEEINSPADLLDRCDKRLLQFIMKDLDEGEEIDKETAAQVLYGSVKGKKALKHIQELLQE